MTVQTREEPSGFNLGKKKKNRILADSLYAAKEKGSFNIKLCHFEGKLQIVLLDVVRILLCFTFKSNQTKDKFK